MTEKRAHVSSCVDFGVPSFARNRSVAPAICGCLTVLYYKLPNRRRAFSWQKPLFGADDLGYDHSRLYGINSS